MREYIEWGKPTYRQKIRARIEGLLLLLLLFSPRLAVVIANIYHNASQWLAIHGASARIHAPSGAIHGASARIHAPSGAIHGVPARIHERYTFNSRRKAIHSQKIKSSLSSRYKTHPYRFFGGSFPRFRKAELSCPPLARCKRCLAPWGLQEFALQTVVRTSRLYLPATILTRKNSPQFLLAFAPFSPDKIPDKLYSA